MTQRPNDQSGFIRSLIAGHQLTFAIPNDYAWIVEEFPGWRNETRGNGDFGAITIPACHTESTDPGMNHELHEVTLRSNLTRRALFRFAAPAMSDKAAAIATQEAAFVALAALGHQPNEATLPGRALAASIPYASPTDYPEGTVAWWIPHILLKGVRPRRRVSAYDLEAHLRAVLSSDPSLRGFAVDEIHAEFSLRHWPFNTPHSSMALGITRSGTREPIALSLTTSVAALALLLAFTPLQRRLALKVAHTPIELAPYATRIERMRPLRVDPMSLEKALAILRRRNCGRLCEALVAQAHSPAQAGRR